MSPRCQTGNSGAIPATRAVAPRSLMSRCSNASTEKFWAAAIADSNAFSSRKPRRPPNVSICSSSMASTISRVRNSALAARSFRQTAEQLGMFTGCLADQLPGLLHGHRPNGRFGGRRRFGRRRASDDRFFFHGETALFQYYSRTEFFRSQPAKIFPKFTIPNPCNNPAPVPSPFPSRFYLPFPVAHGNQESATSHEVRDDDLRQTARRQPRQRRDR